MALTFAGIFGVLALFFGLERLVRADSLELDRRLAHYGARRSAEAEDRPAGRPMPGLMARSVERVVAGRGFAQALATDLARANVKLTVGEFLILQAICALIAAGLAVALARALAPGVLFGVVGFLLPRVWISRRQAARLKAFNEQLADTITLMANSLRSGMSMVQAMEMVSREAGPPVSEEFQRVCREIGLGLSPQEALAHLVRRINSDDLDLMVTAITVQHEVGGNLARILDTIAGTIRERVKLKGEIRTITAQQRAAGYILAGLPLAITGLLTLVAPSYILKLFEPGPWLVLPVLGGTGIVVGFVIIGKIVDIEV